MDFDFERDVLAAEKPTVVRFTAKWCGPCRTMSPIVEAVASRNPGVNFIDVDVDEHEALAAKCGVAGVPTLMIYADGKNMATRVGATTGGVLDSWIKETVGSRAA